MTASTGATLVDARTGKNGPRAGGQGAVAILDEAVEQILVSGQVALLPERPSMFGAEAGQV